MNLQYITDTQGNKLSVILPIRDYEKIIDELEDIEKLDSVTKS